MAAHRKASALIRTRGSARFQSRAAAAGSPRPTAKQRRERIADNRRAIEEAALLEALQFSSIVSGPANGQTLADARATVLDGLLEVLPDAERGPALFSASNRCTRCMPRNDRSSSH